MCRDIKPWRKYISCVLQPPRYLSSCSICASILENQTPKGSSPGNLGEFIQKIIHVVSKRLSCMDLAENGSIPNLSAFFLLSTFYELLLGTVVLRTEVLYCFHVSSLIYLRLHYSVLANCGVTSGPVETTQPHPSFTSPAGDSPTANSKIE